MRLSAGTFDASRGTSISGSSVANLYTSRRLSKRGGYENSARSCRTCDTRPDTPSIVDIVRDTVVYIEIRYELREVEGVIRPSHLFKMSFSSIMYVSLESSTEFGNYRSKVASIRFYIKSTDAYVFRLLPLSPSS